MLIKKEKRNFQTDLCVTDLKLPHEFLDLLCILSKVTLEE